MSAWTSPFPPSEEMRAYEDLDQGRAGKLFQLVEDQARHRMSLENKVITSDIRRSWAGLAVAFLLSASLIVAGTLLIYDGHDTAGASVITITLGGVLVAFIYGRASQQRERQESAKQLTAKKK